MEVDRLWPACGCRARFPSEWRHKFRRGVYILTRGIFSAARGPSAFDASRERATERNVYIIIMKMRPEILINYHLLFGHRARTSQNGIGRRVVARSCQQCEGGQSFALWRGIRRRCEPFRMYKYSPFQI